MMYNNKTLSEKVDNLSGRLNTLKKTIQSGSTSSGSYVTSPDNSVWQISATNLGALVTTKVIGQTGTSFITITSPDNSSWKLTINNSGIPSTTKI